MNRDFKTWQDRDEAILIGFLCYHGVYKEFVKRNSYPSIHELVNSLVLKHTDVDGEPPQDNDYLREAISRAFYFTHDSEWGQLSRDFDLYLDDSRCERELSIGQTIADKIVEAIKPMSEEDKQVMEDLHNELKRADQEHNRVLEGMYTK